MNCREYIKSEESKRRIGESVVGGIVIGSGVAVERFLHQGADMQIVLGAGSIQGMSTFCMALGSISFYDWAVKNYPLEISDSIKKISVGAFLASLSGVINFITQQNTQGSFEESLIMSGIAGTGLIGYEFEIIPRIKSVIVNNKYNTLNILLTISNTLGLK